MSFLDKFNELDAQVSAYFHKETPQGKKISWGKVLILWIVLLVVTTAIGFLGGTGQIEENINIDVNSDLVSGTIFDYPSTYTDDSSADDEQRVINSEGQFVKITTEQYDIDPVTGRENLLENEPGSTPVDREYNGIPFYGIKYTWEGMAMEVGFFPFGTHTYGYTIVGEPDESDVAIMLSNIHGLE
ncbi:hypothetical protein [Methanobrevibacter woesei]|uniref:hypothetical protein n=1 Tax=Methanobrevibacter woesei TaxID=190976 RepID=UPI0023F19CE6|nr:hypothetical protein [Methanobrevibacter woesei]